MAFNWKEYYKLATCVEKGLKGVNEEACLRSAVSRAYYASHCKARNHARDVGTFKPTGTGKDHGGLIQYYRVRQKVKIASRLGMLYEWRNNCDYDDEISDLNKICSNALEQAEKILRIFP